MSIISTKVHLEVFKEYVSNLKCPLDGEKCSAISRDFTKNIHNDDIHNIDIFHQECKTCEYFYEPVPKLNKYKFISKKSHYEKA